MSESSDAGGPTATPTPGVRTLTVLGCDGSYPGPGGAASGYLVRSSDTAVWLDAGPGTFAALQRVIDPGQLDAVVLSHEHPDHWSDVESLAVWTLLAPDRSPPVPVYAPAGLRRRSYFAEHEVFAWHETQTGGSAVIGGLRCRFSCTEHGPTTLAVGVDTVAPDGADRAPALAYSADSGPGWSVESFGRGVGTFLCEATYTCEREGFAGHLSGRQAGAMAAAADVGTLVLTHRWPTVAAEDVRNEAEAAFGRQVHQAVPGAVFTW